MAALLGSGGGDVPSEGGEVPSEEGGEKPPKKEKEEDDEDDEDEEKDEDDEKEVDALSKEAMLQLCQEQGITPEEVQKFCLAKVAESVVGADTSPRASRPKLNQQQMSKVAARKEQMGRQLRGFFEDISKLKKRTLA